MGESVLAFAIVPVPEWVQSKLAKLDAEAGINREAKLMATPWQVSAFVPAVTTAASLINNCVVLVTKGQLPKPFARNVKFTTPVSPTPGW